VFSILCILRFCIVLCTVSPFLYSCLFPTFVQVYRPLHRVKTQRQYINIIYETEATIKHQLKYIRQRTCKPTGTSRTCCPRCAGLFAVIRCVCRHIHLSLLLIQTERRRTRTEVIKVFYYQLMHMRTALKGVLKFTLKQLQHVSV